MLIRAIRLVLLGLGVVTLGALLMVFTYTFRDDRVREHLATSIPQLQLEKSSNISRVALISLTPDYYTDAIMLNEALDHHSSGAVESAFGNYVTMQETPEGEWLPVESLKATYDGKEPGRISYARYWHGYEIVLRPLLMFLDYAAIRWLNAVLLAASVGAVTVLLRYRIGFGTALAFLVSLAVTGIVAVPISMQYSSDFYLALAGIAVVLTGVRGDGRLPYDLETFVVLGALTSFFDLLTAPLVTLGMPLTVLLLARLQAASPSGRGFGRQLRYCASVCSAWSAGYLGCWFSKWVISSSVLHKNVLLDAAVNVAQRLNGAEPGMDLSRLETVRRNVAMLFPLFGCSQPQGIEWGVVAAACLIPGALLLAALVVLLRHLRCDGRRHEALNLLIPAALPFAWYLVANNHSRLHYYFTYRDLGITVFAAVSALFFLVDPHYLQCLKAKLQQRNRS